MSYLTKQDLLDELGGDELARLTSEADGGEIDDTRVATVIADAEGVFEGYIRSRYSLPVQTTNLVKQILKKLAVYELYARWVSIGGKSSRFESITVRRDQAVHMLKDIAAGRAALDVPAAVETKDLPASSDEVLTNSDKSVFTDAKMRSF